MSREFRLDDRAAMHEQSRGRVVILLTDASLGERVRLALGHDHVLFFSWSWAECSEIVRRERAGCVLVSLSEDIANEWRLVIRELHAMVRHARIIGYASPDQAIAASLIAAARAGLDDLVFSGDRDAAALRAAVLRANPGFDAHLADLLANVVRELPRPLHALMRRCIPGMTARESVSELAARLGWHRNTLTSRLERAGGPKPERFRVWCLLLRAGQLLDRTQLTIEAVALGLGFSSASALSHLVSRYVGVSPSGLRADGAVRVIMQRFTAEMVAPVRRQPGVHADTSQCKRHD